MCSLISFPFERLKLTVLNRLLNSRGRLSYENNYGYIIIITLLVSDFNLPAKTTVNNKNFIPQSLYTQNGF